MDEKKLRKQLTILTYSFLFKRFLPSMENNYKIGNIEYAAKLNQLIQFRKVSGYDESPFHDFHLHTIKFDESVHSLSNLNPVNDNNFNNWINGTSNPKNYDIINALIEYVYEVSLAPEKLQQLRLELVSIISHEAFSLYTNHLIDLRIESWTLQLMKETERIEVIRVLKEIIYLLKDRSRNISYLIQTPIPDEPLSLEMEFNPENQEPILTVVPLQKHRKPLLWASLSFVMILIVFITSNAFQSAEELPSPAKKSTVQSADQPATQAATQAVVQSTVQSIAPSTNQQFMEMEEISKIPMSTDIAVPTIISPLNESTLAYEDLLVQWEEVATATSYHLYLKDARSEEIIYEAKDLQETQLLIDRKYLLHGEELLLYMISIQEGSSSDASVVKFDIQALAPPTFKNSEASISADFSDLLVEWNPIVEADSYHLVVTDTERWVNVFDKNYIKETSCLLEQSVFMPGKEYRIYLAAQNRSVESTPSFFDVFIHPLSSPTITSHSSPYEVQNLPFTLLWEPVKHATSYHIDILDTMNWETVYSIKDLRTTSLDIDPSLFEIGGSYRLYLFADLGLSSSAPTYFDITTPELAPPTIIEPANNSLLPHDDIHLRWEENPFATSYKIVVTNTFSWESIYEKKLEEGNTLLIEKSLLTLGSPYRIYIMSLNGSIESVPAYLDVEIQGLPIPEILSPKSGTQYEDQEIRIQWKPNPYITTYKITLVDMTSWTTVFQNEGLVDTEILLDKNLLTTGTIYRAYVQSVMGSIESEPGYVDISLK